MKVFGFVSTAAIVVSRGYLSLAATAEVEAAAATTAMAVCAILFLYLFNRVDRRKIFLILVLDTLYFV